MKVIITYFVMLVAGTVSSYAESKVILEDTHVSNLQAEWVNGSETSFTPHVVQISSKVNFDLPAEKCTELSVIGAGIAAPANQNLKDLANSSLGQAVTGQASNATPVDPTAKIGESLKQPDLFKNADPKISVVSAAGYDIGSHISGDELLKSAQVAQTTLANFADEDQEFVSASYRNMDRAQFQDHINRATENLSQAIKTLDQGKSDLDEGDVARLKNQYMNALDKAQAAKELMAEDTFFKNSLSEHPLAKSPALKDLFPSSDDKAASSDAVTDRLLMFNGLPKQQQEKILNEQRLKFADYRPFKMKDGTTRKIALLHNGGLSGKNETDCTTLIGSLLQPDARKGNFTTLDFRTMWIYKKRGFFPNPPQYPSQKAKLIRETADAFTPVDLYEGEQLIPGDILVHRLPWDTAGNMFIVKSYNSKTLTAEVIDASRSGKMKQTTFSITDKDSTKQVKMGLMGLRLKPTKNNDCKMKVAQITKR